MDVDLGSELERVAAESFAALSFMLPVDEPGDGAQPALGEAVMVAVAFHGPQTGLLTLAVSAEMLPVLAGNMTGEEAPPAAEQQHDALREMLNVICGNILPVLGGVEAVFDVGAPFICPRVVTSADVKPVATARLNLDSGRVELAFYTAASGIPVCVPETAAAQGPVQS